MVLDGDEMWLLLVFFLTLCNHGVDGDGDEIPCWHPPGWRPAPLSARRLANSLEMDVYDSSRCRHSEHHALGAMTSDRLML